MDDYYQGGGKTKKPDWYVSKWHSRYLRPPRRGDSGLYKMCQFELESRTTAEQNAKGIVMVKSLVIHKGFQTPSWRHLFPQTLLFINMVRDLLRREDVFGNFKAFFFLGIASFASSLFQF